MAIPSLRFAGGIRGEGKGWSERKSFGADKESSGTDKGVEGRKKGYGVGWRDTPEGWGLTSRFSPLPLDGVHESFFFIEFGHGVLA